MVVVESNVEKVQHPTGGIVGELRVGDDQRVNEGDVLLRIDETQTRANLAVFTKGLDELNARQARLEAEKDGVETIQFPEDLLAREATDPEVAHVLAGERKLFSLILESSNGQKAQLRERLAQLKEQVSGITEQIDEAERYGCICSLCAVQEFPKQHFRSKDPVAHSTTYLQPRHGADRSKAKRELKDQICSVQH